MLGRAERVLLVLIPTACGLGGTVNQSFRAGKNVTLDRLRDIYRNVVHIRNSLPIGRCAARNYSDVLACGKQRHRNFLPEKPRPAGHDNRRRAVSCVGRLAQRVGSRECIADSLTDCNGFDEIGPRYGITTTAANGLVVCRKDLRQARVAPLLLEKALAHRGGRSRQELPSKTIWRNQLVDPRRSGSDVFLYRAAHVISVHRSVGANQSQIAFDWAALERDDERSRHGAATHESVYGSPRSNLDGSQLCSSLSRALQEFQEQIHGVRQDVEQLQI